MFRHTVNWLVRAITFTTGPLEFIRSHATLALLGSISFISTTLGFCDLATTRYSKSCCIVKNFSNDSLGSGFICGVLDSDSVRQFILVTNKHVVGQRKNTTIGVRVRISVPRDTIEWIQVPITSATGEFVSTVRVHPTADVACVNVTEIFMQRGVVITWIGAGVFASDDSLRVASVGSGDDVLLLGYPRGIYDESTALPVVKQGALSTDPTHDYRFPEVWRKREPLNTIFARDTAHVFLVDVNALPGSSGSLIILKGRPQGAYSESRMEIWDKPPVVLGIFAGLIPETTGGGRFYPLGIAYSWKAILEALSLFERM